MRSRSPKAVPVLPLGLPLVVSFVLALGVGACGDKDPIGGSETETTTAETGTETETEGETTAAPFEPYAARDLAIIRVEANPGVAVPIGLDGGEVAGEGRNAYIPPRRDTLIRAFVDVGDGWVPRPIEGRLVITQADGSETELRDVFTIDEDTREGVLTSGPYFGVDAAELEPGASYRLSLWETEEGHEALPEVASRFPHDGGDAIIGVETAYLNMRLVLVPVAYSFDTCTAEVDGDAVAKGLHDALFQQNPLENLDLEVHAPYSVTYDMSTYSGLNKLVNEMSQLRAAENADPEVYYYALFDNCGRCINSGGVGGGCTVGLAANITGDRKTDAWARVAAGQLNNNAAGTFVHEIGHIQGRRHIDCPGAGTQAAGTDPTYPHEGGKIGVWGFGIRDFGLRHPTSIADYMSYCSRSWCSDWQWNATYRRIQTLSSWELEGSPAPAGGGLLIGALAPDGSEEWWTVPGELEEGGERSAVHRIRFTLGDQVIEEAAEVSVRPHIPTVNLVIPLPAAADPELRGLTIHHLDGETERPITVESARILHGAARRSAG